MGIQSHLFFFYFTESVFLVLIHFLTDLLFLRLYVIVQWNNFKNINLNMVQEGCHFSVSCCVKY